MENQAATLFYIPMDLLAFVALFLGIMFTVTAAVGLFFPHLYRNRKTGLVPKRSRLLIYNLTVASVFYLSVIMLSHYM